MAHETQYCSFKYIFGTAYSGKTEASEISPGIKPHVSVRSSRWCGVFPVDFHRVGKPRGEARRTDSSTLNHVADGESLDRLVLWCTPRTIGAADGLDVTSSLLVATAVVAMLVAGSEISDFGVGWRTWMLVF